MDDQIVSIQTPHEEKGSNLTKPLLIGSVALLLIILFGLGYFVYKDYQKTLRLQETALEVQKNREITLLPEFAQKQKYPEEAIEPLSNLNDPKVESLLLNLKLLDTNPGFVKSFTVNYTFTGVVTEIKSEYIEGNQLVYNLTLRNEEGKTVTLNFSLEEIGTSQVFSDRPGNIEEVGFLDLKQGDQVEIRATNVLTNSSPVYYLIRILYR